jgi:hypothetical protein
LLEAGIVGSADDLLELALDDVLGLYLDTTKEILLIDQGEPTTRLSANTTLGHELIHALQDQTYDLAAHAANAANDVDAQLGFASLVEGETSFHEVRMLLAYEGRSLADFDFDVMREVADDMSREMGSPALMSRNLFPYTYGLSYAADLWQLGGSAALDAAYAGPAPDSLEIVEGVRSARDPVIAAPAPLDGYVVVEQQVYGAWIMAATLGGLSDASPSDLGQLAADWRGDLMSVYRQSVGNGVAVDWTIHAASPAAAQRLAGIYQRWEPPAGQLALDVDGSALHVVVSDTAGSGADWLARWDQ